MTPHALACHNVARKNVARSIWQGHRSSLPLWLEILAGIARSGWAVLYPRPEVR